MKKFRLLLAIFLVFFVATSSFAVVGDIVAKDKLSGSTDGKGIKVAATSTPGTTIHTAVTGATNFDEVWLWCYNGGSETETITIEWGGTTDPDNTIVQSVPKDAGLFLVVPGLILQNAGVIRAFAATDSMVIYGFTNEMQ